MKGGREAGEADRGFGERRFLREGEGSEQLHGGEKVLYIRGEVAYNTARYWFCFFRCRSVRSWDWRGAAGRRFCFCWRSCQRGAGGVAGGQCRRGKAQVRGRLCRKGDFV